MLNESERLAVVVTEMLRLTGEIDLDTRYCGQRILTATLNDPRLRDEDRRLIDLARLGRAGDLVPGRGVS